MADDGMDMGVDGEINVNDKKSFPMKAIVKKRAKRVNVTPASTVVAEMVEDGAIPLDEAQKSFNEAFGLAPNSSLNSFDPTENDISNKLGNLLALLADSIPSTDKGVVFKSIAKVVIKKKISIKITNESVELKSLNLTDIADEVQLLSPDSISVQDIYKITKVQKLIKARLVDTVEKIKPVKYISKAEKIKVLASKIAFELLIKEVQKSNLDSLDEEELELFSDKVEDSSEAVFEDGSINDSSDEEVELFSDIVKENLDADSNKLSIALIHILKDYKIVSKHSTKISVKKIIKYIYKHTDISDMKNITNVTNSLKDEKVIEQISDSADVIEENIATESGEIKTQVQDELEDSVAGAIATKIDESDKEIVESGAIGEAIDNSVKNPIFVESIKETVKIKISIKLKAKKLKKGKRLGHNDKARLIACKNVMKSIKVNIKVKKFTKVSQTSLNEVFTNLTQTMENFYSQSSISELSEQIHALNIAFFDFSEIFNLNNFNETITSSIKIIQNIKVTNGASMFKSKLKIKIKIKNDFVKVKIKFIKTIKIIIINPIIVAIIPKQREVRFPTPPILKGGVKINSSFFIPQ